MVVFDAFLWFSQDLTNQNRYPFVRTEIWYRWMILSWSHVPINSFDMTLNNAKVGDAWCFWSDFLTFFENVDFLKLIVCFEHLTLPESISRPKSACEHCGWLLFSWIFMFSPGLSCYVVCHVGLWFLTLSLQALRTETMVDGLPRASTFGESWVGKHCTTFYRCLCVHTC